MQKTNITNFSIGVFRLVLKCLCVEETHCHINGAHVRRSRFSRDSIESTLRTAGVNITSRVQDYITDSLAGIHRKPLDVKVDRSMFSAFNILCGICEVFLDDDPEFITKVSHTSVSSFTLPFAGMEHSKAIKELKFATSYWLAAHWKNELPEGDGFDPYVFKGMMRQYLRRRCSWRRTRRSSKLFNSLLQAKRSCDSVPEDFVNGTYVKHAADLSKQDPPSFFPSLFTPLIEERMDTILKKFPLFSPELFEPSHSACYERTRGDGGSSSVIKDEFSERGLLSMRETRPGHVERFYGWYAPSTWELTHETFEREEGFNIEDRFEILDKNWPPKLVFDDSNEPRWLTWRDLLTTIPPVEYDADYSFLSSLVQSWSTERPAGIMTCTVAGIKEPLKVRTVTKGRALPYWTVKSVQKWMHSSLRKIPQFRLIGETVTDEVMADFFAKVEKWPLLISGDYSSATDKLEIWVTKTIFFKILDRLVSDMDKQGRHQEGLELEKLCQKVLFEHEIHYPKKSGVQPVIQGTGQLMGSPLSFPVLCLANLICYWIALQEHDGLEELNVLVNGDDIAFGTDKDGYSKWSQYVKTFGFVKSVGKNYSDSRFVIINSTMFDRRSGPGETLRVPYYPVGLLMGRSKVAKDVEDGRPPIIASLDLVIEGAQDPTRALDVYMSLHREDIEKITWKKRNLFLPLELGGCGVKQGRAEVMTRDGLAKSNITLWQRRFATYLRKEESLLNLGLQDPNKMEQRPFQIMKRRFIDVSHPDFEVLRFNASKEYREDKSRRSPIGFDERSGNNPLVFKCPLRRHDWEKVSKSTPITDAEMKQGLWIYQAD